MNPELSVIIPTYKRTGSLKKLLEILFNQQTACIEVIVIDQNPGNYFGDTMDAFLGRAKWIKQEKPNASDARNRGFLASTAPYLLFIDDDLIPEKDFCRQGIDIFIQFKNIDSFSPLVYNDEGQGAAVNYARTKYLTAHPANNEIFSITDTISAAIFFRRDAYFQTGGFDDFLFEFARTAEDRDFFLRMRKKGMTHWFVPLVKVFHDEKIPGGCDLRTEDYWITREKCMKAWALGYRTNKGNGKINAGDFVKLFRSCILNLEVLNSSPKYIARQFYLMKKAINESRSFFNKRSDVYIFRINNGFLV